MGHREIHFHGYLSRHLRWQYYSHIIVFSVYWIIFIKKCYPNLSIQWNYLNHSYIRFNIFSEQITTNAYARRLKRKSQDKGLKIFIKILFPRSFIFSYLPFMVPNKFHKESLVLISRSSSTYLYIQRHMHELERPSWLQIDRDPEMESREISRIRSRRLSNLASTSMVSQIVQYDYTLDWPIRQLFKYACIARSWRNMKFFNYR